MPKRDGSGDLVFDGSGDLEWENSTDRWVGSGRVVVDNKGNVVKQYEPFFSGSSEFTPETELTEWGVTPLFFYDPVGRNTRVELPDDSVRTWVFNPWRLEAKDEEDNNSGGDHENTPTITHLDAQGRVFRTDAYLVDASTVTNEDTDTDVLRTVVEMDVQGNPVTVTDPRGNDIQEQTFDLLGRPLFTGSADEGYTGSNDTGETRILPDVAGQVVQTWRSHDGSNELVLTRTFDTLRRPVQLSVTDDGGTTTRLVEYRLYGEFDGGSGTKARGRLWRLYDTAGELELTEYDFKGNILEMSKTLPDDFTADEDWTGIAANSTKTALNTWLAPGGGGAGTLSGDTYTLERTFDALNRLLTETGPDAEIGGSGAASVTTYGYDKGGRLKTVDITVRGGSSTPIVSDITYNARGQRLTIVKGDDGTATKFATTTYTYDADRLWLKTLTTLRDGDTASQDELQLLTYTRDLVGNITEIDDEAQSNHYHNNTQVNRTRTFTYDALYRLASATGREKDALAQPGPSLPSKYAVPAPGAQDALMRNYTQTYFYDEAGNLTEMKHVANSTTQWRRGYDLATGNNQLLKSSEPGDTFGTPSTYSSSYTYNRRGAMVFLPHLYDNSGADNLERDYRDQLRKAILNANDDAYYVYDAAGNRVAKYVEGGQNRYVTLYLWGYEVYQEIDSTGPTVKEERHTIHVMDDVNRVCLIESRTIQSSGSYTHAPTPLCRFQFDDHLGTACVETDVAMAVISYEEYHPYGTTAWWASNAAVDKRYRFTGKERDEETGLSYHGQRYLITWLGRWERADPIGLGDGGNRFWFGRGNALSVSDPSGLVTLQEVLGADDANLDRLAAEGAWVEATLRETTFEAWDTFTLGFVTAHDQVVDARHSGETTRGEYLAKTTALAAPRVAVIAAPLAVGGMATGVGGSMVRQGAVLGGVGGLAADSVVQAGDVAAGVQDTYDPVRGVLAAGTGAVAGGALGVAAEVDMLIETFAAGADAAMRSYAAEVAAANRVSPPTVSSTSGRSLVFHENVGQLASPKGHPVSRHVGKTDADLAARLASEAHVPRASSFPDVATAEAAVGEILSQNRSAIVAWQRSGFAGGDLILQGSRANGAVSGSVLSRGATASQATSDVTVVLRADAGVPETGGWRIHTAFPGR